MEKTTELTIDLKDYTKEDSVFKRTAARGIICKNGKYLLIFSKYGDYKFPGGGMKKNETIKETLIREVAEETGYIVKESSIKESLIVHEKRKGCPEDIMLMDSYYFYCEVENDTVKRNLDDYEAEYDYQICWITLEDAIKNNKSLENIDKIPWVRRDTMVQEYLLGLFCRKI